VWNRRSIVRILVYILVFRCPPAVLRGSGLRDGVISGPARGPKILLGGVPSGGGRMRTVAICSLL
jgi:hypothetical protein